MVVKSRRILKEVTVMKNLGYYNGVFDEIENMQIPMNDRVCYFGDGVYDATYSRNYKIYELNEHIDRLYRSASLLRIEIAQTKEEMKEILKMMGIVDAFDSEMADFSGLGTSTAGNIFADRVIHKTFIEVSPVGTKAGAATVIEMKDECVAIYDDSKEVILDRPFIYMIIDCETNQPIFMGTVNHVDTQK